MPVVVKCNYLQLCADNSKQEHSFTANFIFALYIFVLFQNDFDIPLYSLSVAWHYWMFFIIEVEGGTKIIQDYTGITTYLVMYTHTVFN